MATKPEIVRKISKNNFTAASKSRQISYLVIHWVGAVSTAANNASYFQSYRGSSAHYFVDAKSIYQVVEDWNIAWHCGTKGTYYHKFARNSNSIGIEMCLDKANHISEETLKRTETLVQYLMDLYHIPAENVIRHYDVTHKSCPGIYVDNIKWKTLHTDLVNKDSNSTADDAFDVEIKQNAQVAAPTESSIKVDRYGVVESDSGCNIRLLPSGGDKVTGHEDGIPTGTVVFIKYKQDGKYLVTLMNGVKGWVTGSNIAMGDPMKVVTKTDPLKMRAGRGQEYGVIMKIPKGATVTQLRHYTNGWEKVIYDYRIGYCASQYLKYV